MTLGLLVFVQLVIAAITTDPERSSNGYPSISTDTARYASVRTGAG